MHNSSELSFDLLILGQDPAVCLLALLAARSGHRVAVIGSAFSVPFWAVAFAPFAWFGEPEPEWEKSWIKSAFSGVAWLEAEKKPDLLEFTFYHLDGSRVFQTMSEDAETWGAVFVDGQGEPTAGGVLVQDQLWAAPICFDLRSAQPDSLAGRWIWSSDCVLSAPSVFEIYPEQGPLWLWSESLADSYFSLAGNAGAPPELGDFFSNPDELQAFSASPLFLAPLTELGPIAWDFPLLRFPTPPAGPEPWSAVLQGLYLLWARYAGEQIAMRGLADPLLIPHLQGYWEKLRRVAGQKREKNNFLQ